MKELAIKAKTENLDAVLDFASEQLEAAKACGSIFFRHMADSLYSAPCNPNQASLAL